MSILVIGSFMMDLVVRAPRVPENGETIIGDSFARYPGGKGANQAVTAARLGKKVTMIGKLGIDEFGNEAINTLNKEGVNTDYMLRDPLHPTGVGSVTLDKNGDNRIIVVPGANAAYHPDELEQVTDLIREAEIIILQLETNLDLVEKAVDLACLYQTPVILNPAPAAKLSDDLLSKITYLTPNESEAEILTGISVNSLNEAEQAGRILLNKGVANVIITLADKGAIIVNDEGTAHVPAFYVEPLDSVAAGDAFNGALGVGLANREPLEKVVRYANAVGALTVTRPGAIPSLPYKQVVEAFITQKEV
ncbi:ribokinase [Gracilibacillus alcaliphilus]|uniref:ribokinase n=1 Tax=Gracilibacillus alcaliphilus TaxID=1401441 RepID=UPI001958CBD1|nr:ribokinase [Gracilibacillus alcaliphilus]